MTLSMFAQIGGTFLLSWVVGVAMTHGEYAFLALIVATIVGLAKTSGLFGGRTYTTIAVEVGYIMAMVMVMVAVHFVV